MYYKSFFILSAQFKTTADRLNLKYDLKEVPWSSDAHASSFAKLEMIMKSKKSIHEIYRWIFLIITADKK